jgi:hypothetical protein
MSKPISFYISAKRLTPYIEAKCLEDSGTCKHRVLINGSPTKASISGLDYYYLYSRYQHNIDAHFTDNLTDHQKVTSAVINHLYENINGIEYDRLVNYAKTRKCRTSPTSPCNANYYIKFTYNNNPNYYICSLCLKVLNGVYGVVPIMNLGPIDKPVESKEHSGLHMESKEHSGLHMESKDSTTCIGCDDGSKITLGGISMDPYTKIPNDIKQLEKKIDVLSDGLVATQIAMTDLPANEPTQVQIKIDESLMKLRTEFIRVLVNKISQIKQDFTKQLSEMPAPVVDVETSTPLNGIADLQKWIQKLEVRLSNVEGDAVYAHRAPTSEIPKMKMSITSMQSDMEDFKKKVSELEAKNAELELKIKTMSSPTSIAGGFVHVDSA